MKPISQRRVAAGLLMLVALGTGGAFLGTPGVREVAAQSLAEVARAEAARRDSVKEHGWVFNDFNLPAAPDRPTDASAEPDAEPSPETMPLEPDTEHDDAAASAGDGIAPEPDAGDKRTQAEWRAQAESLKLRTARLRESETGLESRLKELQRLTEGRREDEAPAASREQGRTTAALAKVQRDIASLDVAWTRLAEDADRANVPPDWLATP